jgi:lysozyme
VSLGAFARLHPDYGTDWVPGVDVSGHQTADRLAAELAWARWAWIKATEGRTFFEPDVTAAHVEQCRARGVPYGFYHFAQPSQGDPAGQARHFANAIAAMGGPGIMPPVLDLEAAGGDLNGFALTFLATIEQLTGRRPVLYSYAGFISSNLWAPELGAYPLWLAHYANPGVPAWCPPPWSDWVAWQWQSVTAEHGHLDVNVARPAWIASLTGGGGGAGEELGGEETALLLDIARYLGWPDRMVA